MSRIRKRRHKYYNRHAGGLLDDLNPVKKYKHYKDPNKTDRASKVFGYDKYENPENAAMTHQAEQGVGIVKHFPAMAVRCRYCSVQPICSQSASMLMEGRLDL